jgi:hypothetical protein
MQRRARDRRCCGAHSSCCELRVPSHGSDDETPNGLVLLAKWRDYGERMESHSYRRRAIESLE